MMPIIRAVKTESMPIFGIATAASETPVTR
jgi:hypothetical protein